MPKSEMDHRCITIFEIIEVGFDFSMFCLGLLFVYIYLYIHMYDIYIYIASCSSHFPP